MVQTCSGEEVGREDTREEEADVMRCGVVWCDVETRDGRDQGHLLSFLVDKFSRAGSLCMCRVYSETVQC